jgi:hypothetical protein
MQGDTTPVVFRCHADRDFHPLEEGKLGGHCRASGRAVEEALGAAYGRSVAPLMVEGRGRPGSVAVSAKAGGEEVLPLRSMKGAGCRLEA